MRLSRRPILDSELRWALGFIRPYRGRLALVLGLTLLGTVVALILPYLSKWLIDDALIGRSMSALLRVVALWLGLTIVNFFLNLLSGLRYTAVSADVLFDMRLTVYRHLQALSPRFYARTPLGEIVSRINNDIAEVQRVVSDSALAWIGHVLFLVGTVLVMIWLDVRLFLVGVVVMPLSLIALQHYRQRLEISLRALRARSAEIGSFLIETLQAMRLIVASGAQEREAGRFRSRNDAFVGELMRMQWLRYLAGGLPGVLLTAGTAIVFLYGGSRVVAGDLTLGDFVAFMAYQMRLASPVQGLMGLYANLATVRVSLRRVHELLEESPDVVERPGAMPLVDAAGDLVLENVSFGFDRGAPVLTGVDLRIPPGQRVALVGASGSGKSTIADLLSRQLDPEGGHILLDGFDLRDIRLADLRRQVVAVEQDPFLFHATIAENVRYAGPAATDAEVLRALQDAGLGEFITRLPEGVNTVVGERGRTLSTGERQRVAFARALLTDPGVLILDEPTSALDPAAEATVIESYWRAAAARTVIVITHRPELARRADRVIVLEDGRIALDATPADLFRHPDSFRDLFDRGPARAAGTVISTG